MSKVLAISLQAMHADMARVEQIATNLANVQTPAFKRGWVTQAPIAASPFAAAVEAGLDPQQAAAAAVRTHTDWTEGTLKATGAPLDLALVGKGYFEVQTPEGPAYTRRGNFRIDAAHRLVTAEGGYPVMGERGEITLEGSQPVVTPDGTVQAGGAQPGQRLKVVMFDTTEQPTVLGQGLVTWPASARAALATQVQVRQGALENANVEPAREMTALMLATRHFETMQKVVQGHDEMLATAIRKLGETN